MLHRHVVPVRLAVVKAAVGLCALAVVASARADAFPSKAVRIIVPFAVGGGVDLTARFIGQQLAASLGKPVLVENKPGAGGAMGIEAGIKSPADGYTLVMVNSGYAANASFYKLSYDPVRDISPIVEVSENPQVVVVNPSVPAMLPVT